MKMPQKHLPWSKEVEEWSQGFGGNAIVFCSIPQFFA